MKDKFRNRYRIKSNRLPGWDYSENGYYFITLMTQNRECNLGKIIEIPVEMHGKKNVETHGRASLPQSPEPPSLYRKPKSISSFIGGFKSVVNSKIDDYIDENHLNIPKYNRNNHFFQPDYHDYIIRNAKEYFQIKNYIRNNPARWNKDIFG